MDCHRTKLGFKGPKTYFEAWRHRIATHLVLGPASGFALFWSINETRPRDYINILIYDPPPLITLPCKPQNLIVYIFPRYLSTLCRELREGIMLDPNWLQTFKESVKLSHWWNVWLFGWIIREKLAFKTARFLVGKSAGKPILHFFVKFWLFKSVWYKKCLIHRDQIP